MDNKLDHDRIIKAMEHCAYNEDCNNCPYCDLRVTTDKACAIIIDSYLLVKELINKEKRNGQ